MKSLIVLLITFAGCGGLAAIGCWIEYAVEQRGKRILPPPSACVGTAYRRHWNIVGTRQK